ncbi:unnamed protein product, partial [Didymodactylos carnosus]
IRILHCPIDSNEIQFAEDLIHYFCRTAASVYDQGLELSPLSFTSSRTIGNKRRLKTTTGLGFKPSGKVASSSSSATGPGISKSIITLIDVPFKHIPLEQPEGEPEQEGQETSQETFKTAVFCERGGQWRSQGWAR